MINTDRWQQRFQNFEKAFRQLEDATQIPLERPIEKAGLIQIFKFSFELAWKTLKDYLEKEGHHTPSPRATIKQAFQNGLISDGHLWLDALEKRNLMAHAYDEQKAEQAIRLIRDHYYDLLKEVHETLRTKQDD